MCFPEALCASCLVDHLQIQDLSFVWKRNDLVMAIFQPGWHTQNGIQLNAACSRSREEDMLPNCFHCVLIHFPLLAFWFPRTQAQNPFAEELQHLAFVPILHMYCHRAYMIYGT